MFTENKKFSAHGDEAYLRLLQPGAHRGRASLVLLRILKTKILKTGEDYSQVIVQLEDPEKYKDMREMKDPVRSSFCFFLR